MTMNTGLMDAYAGGNVFFVADDNRGSGGGSNTNPGTRARPFATIDYAIGRCTANQGDMIMVMPGYAQDISAASGITFDVAGIRVVGMGEGNLRPKLTYQAAASTIVISAADVVLENFIHIASYADVVNPIVTTAAGTVIINHSFRDEAADLNFANIVLASGGSDRDNDRLTIKDCWYGTADAQGFNFLQIQQDVHDLVIENCVFETVAVATVEFMSVAAGASIFGARIDGVYTRNADVAAAISLIVFTDQTDNTGVVSNCFAGTLDTAGELLCTASAGMQFTNCRGSSVINTQGYTLPTVDAVD